MGKRPDKHKDVLPRTRERMVSGRYRDTRHATERKDERRIGLPEIRQVIESGWHEKSKDEFKIEWQAWNYAIRGKTIDGRALRIAISFDEEDWLLIITAIEL
ncbi:MAG: DUF4258 domain-containing protein [Planctomycetes bacterium]|nr:DUF4258 domain-containing protein [Planctomycetota bacterium]